MAQHASDIIIENQEHMDNIEQYCLPDETIRAVFDLKGMHAGYLAILDKRIICYAKAFGHKKKAMITIPYNRIHAISCDDETGKLIKKGMFSSSALSIHAGNDVIELEFRGGDKSHRAYQLMIDYLAHRS